MVHAERNKLLIDLFEKSITTNINNNAKANYIMCVFINSDR